MFLFFFFASGFGFFFGFLSRYHLPCICNSLELEPVILHGICYTLAWSLCILHGICYIWPMFAFHFAWYLSHVGISTSHLHGICCILVLQMFMWVSWGFFRLSFRVSFNKHKSTHIYIAHRHMQNNSASICCPSTYTCIRLICVMCVFPNLVFTFNMCTL